MADLVVMFQTFCSRLSHSYNNTCKPHWSSKSLPGTNLQISFQNDCLPMSRSLPHCLMGVEVLSSMGRRVVVEFRALQPQSSFHLTGCRGRSDEVPEGDNIVGDRPADDKRVLRTHLFLRHFAEAGTGPHFTQMHLLFQLQAGGGPASQMMDFLGQIVTPRPPESGHTTFQSCRCSDSNKPPQT